MINLTPAPLQRERGLPRTGLVSKWNKANPMSREGCIWARPEPKQIARIEPEIEPGFDHLAPDENGQYPYACGKVDCYFCYEMMRSLTPAPLQVERGGKRTGRRQKVVAVEPWPSVRAAARVVMFNKEAVFIEV